jgi:hypothetical protein
VFVCVRARCVAAAWRWGMEGAALALSLPESGRALSVGL